jgi:rubrerythrin
MVRTMEEAIKNAIEYETKVRKVYEQAEAQAEDSLGKRVLKVLADEEQRHLDYLEHKLKEWRDTGVVTVERLETVIPSKEVIEREVGKLREKMQAKTRQADAELRMLNKALKVEIETSEFYKRMVRELPEEGQKFFERFVEIEEGHRAIVQAEIDYLTGSGFYFDFREFDLEAGG